MLIGGYGGRWSCRENSWTRYTVVIEPDLQWLRVMSDNITEGEELAC